MNLISDIRNFFLRERSWGILFVMVLAIFAANVFWSSQRAEEPRSQTLEKLHLAETKLKEEIHSSGGMSEFLAKRPAFLRIFNFLTLLLLAAVFAGLILDFFWLVQPSWRARLQRASGPPEARTWSLRTIFKTVLLFILASFSLSLFLFFLRALFFQGTSRNLLVLIHTTLSDLLCIGLVVAFIHRLGGRWQDLGFRGVRWWNDFWVGLAGYLAVLPLFILVLVLLVVLAQLFAYEPPPHPLVEVFLEEERSPAMVAYSIFLACVAGPFFEEIFFRGFCYPAFKKRWGVGWGLVLSAAFFGAIHQNIFAFWPIFVLGLALGYLYEKRGTLVPSIALHIIHNSVFIGYFFLVKEVLART